MSGGRTFEFDLGPGVDVGRLLAEAEARAAGGGITLRGDAVAGTFSGAAQGSYRVSGGKVHVEVRSKPALVPWALVESLLRRLFA